MTPEEHLCFIYKAKIEPTGRDIAKLADTTFMSYSADPSSSIHLDILREKEIAIKMSESEFNKFMNGYQNYLTLIYGMKDPIAKDMFEKLMLYLMLRK